MEDKVYTLLDLSEEFGKDKQLIRRRLSKLKLKAINKDSREHINEPLEYDFDTYVQLANEFAVSNSNKRDKSETRDDMQSNTHETRGDTQSDTQEKTENVGENQVIEFLERELKHSKDKLQKSEEEKETLMKLLDQQQRLSLQVNQKVQMLEVNEQEIKEEIKGDKKKWWHFFSN